MNGVAHLSQILIIVELYAYSSETISANHRIDILSCLITQILVVREKDRHTNKCRKDKTKNQPFEVINEHEKTF